MEQSINIYLDYLTNDKKASQNTILSYKRDLMGLNSYIKKIRGNFLVNDITITDLNSYILELERKHMANTTISRNISSIKAFYGFLFKNKIVDEDISDKLKAPKISRRVPQAITYEEAQQLLAQPSKNTPKEIRDKAMLELLYSTGIQVSEIVNLTLNDVDLKIGYIVCRDELSNNEKVLPLDKNTVAYLKKYLNIARKEFVSDDTYDIFFVNCKGTQMSRQGFWKLIKHYANKAGIDSDITSHTIRRSLEMHKKR